LRRRIERTPKAGKIGGDGRVRAKVTPSIQAIGLRHEVEDDIETG
jgi:hypothetical protein